MQAADKEVEEYAAVIAAPQAGIADRKALTGQLRDRFNAVEDKFAMLDDMILQFNPTPAGLSLRDPPRLVLGLVVVLALDVPREFEEENEDEDDSGNGAYVP